MNPSIPITTTGMRPWLHLLALCASLALPPSASAAAITWGAATTISGDTDVSTNGTFSYAYYWSASAGNQTVNDVTFTRSNTNTGGSNVTLSFPNGYRYDNLGGGAATPFTGLSAAYKPMVAGAINNNAPYSGTGTVTLNNLAVGHNYAVQVWMNDSRAANTKNAVLTSSGGNSVTLTYNVANTTGGVGQYSIGTFTATATTQAFTTASTSAVILNAIQLRDLGVSNVTLAPTFNPAAGTYFGAQTVTISCATPGTTIYYTTDGSTPTSSSSSGTSGLTVSVPVSTTMTIKAYGQSTGNTDSTVASADYTTYAPATGTWANTDGGSWTTPGNWTGNTIADGSDNTADFSALTLTANQTVTLDAAVTIGNLLFDDQAGTKHAWTLNAGTVGTLTMAVSSGTPTINNNVATTIGAVLGGTQGLSKTGNGTLFLTGASNYSGTTTINAGTISVSSNNAALGNSSVDIGSSGTLAITDYRTLANTITGSGAITVSGTGGANLSGSNLTGFTGTINIATTGPGKLILVTPANIASASSTINVANGATYYSDTATNYAGTVNVQGAGNNEGFGALRLDSGSKLSGAVHLLGNTSVGSAFSTTGNISGNIDGDFVLNKIQSSTLVLSGNNSYTGGTTVTAGTLLVTNTTSSGTGSGLVSVSANGTLGGTGTVSGAVTASGSLAPGITGTGTLTTGAVTLTGTYRCQINGVNCDKLAVDGTLTLTGATLAISLVNPPTATSYEIATYTGEVPSFTMVTGLPGGYRVSTATAGKILLVGSPAYYAWLVANSKTDSAVSLKEFGLGTLNSGAIVVNGPNSITLGQVPAMQISGANVSVLFGRRQDYQAAGLTYQVKFSTDLTNWFYSTDTTNLMYEGSPDLDNPAVVASEGGMNAVSVPFPLFIKTANGFEKAEASFMTLEISLP